MRTWKKLGCVFVPDGSKPWMRTHASNPVVRKIDGDLHRIYVSGRNDLSQAAISYIEIDMRNPGRVLRESDGPVLEPGKLGAFDDSGVSMGCFAEIGGVTHLYYLGWNLGVTVPWRNSIGCAIEQPDGSFLRISEAPVLDRGHTDPYSISFPWIVQNDDRYHMWYGSNLSWGESQEDMEHVFKYAVSRDGLFWERDGSIALQFKDDTEYALSKPCVVVDPDKWRMWYSYRGETYRIGYAESDDGLSWTRRDDQAGIDVSGEGWDSQSVEYPCVFDYESNRYMLYNGNRDGLTGFGIAVLEES